MIEVTYEGGTYLYQKKEDGSSYWLGSGMRRGPRHPGRHCVAPRCIWTDLQSIAQESGVDPAEFRAKKAEEKPKRSPAKKKSNRPTISIFSEV